MGPADQGDEDFGPPDSGRASGFDPELERIPGGFGEFPPRRKRGPWAVVLGIVGGLAGLSCLGCVGFFAWFFTVAPDTQVAEGASVPERHLKTMRDLGVLEEGERVRFFYSDAFLDIEDGFYTLTDRALRIYVKEWEEPSVRIPFEKLTGIGLARGGFFEDSTVTVQIEDGNEYEFPLSTEKGGDKRFVAALRKAAPGAKDLGAGGPAPDEPGAGDESAPPARENKTPP